MLETFKYYIAVAIDIQRKLTGCELPCLSDHFVGSLGLKIVLATLLPMILFVCIHLVVVRIFRINQYVALKFTFVLGVGAIMSSLKIFDLEALVHSVLKIVAFALFSYNFFHLLNLRETGRRVRLLTELSASSMTRRDLMERYSIKELVDRRIDRLIDAGRIEERDGVLIEKNRGLLWGDKLLKAVKVIFFGRNHVDE